MDGSEFVEDNVACPIFAPRDTRTTTKPTAEMVYWTAMQPIGVSYYNTPVQ